LVRGLADERVSEGSDVRLDLLREMRPLGLSEGDAEIRALGGEGRQEVEAEPRALDRRQLQHVSDVG
jgi:hypothetical protein